MPAVAAPGPGPALAGREYFVDSTRGDDSLNGLTASAAGAGAGPWKTLARLAQADLLPGDHVRLACGSVWREPLQLKGSGQPGKPITVAAHPSGCAQPPVLDGSTSLLAPAWRAAGGNVYSAALSTTPRLLLTTAGPMTPAHHPNRGHNPDQPNSVFLAVATDAPTSPVNGRPVSQQFSSGADLVLPAGALLGTGTQVRLRTNSWTLDERSVTQYQGTTFTLGSPSSWAVQAGWGYYLAGQRWMLDSPGEWHHDPASQTLHAWLPDGRAPTGEVHAIHLGAAIDLQGRSHIVVDGLWVRRAVVGANVRSSTGVELRNCRIEDTAGLGVDAAASQDATVTRCTLARTGRDAISGLDDSLPAATGMRVIDNTVSESALRLEAGRVVSLPVATRAAIRAGHGALVSGNSISHTAYIGIWSLPGSTVANNLVRDTCLVLDDCASIYASGAGNRSTIRGNLVLRVHGGLDGKAPAWRYTQAQGIYLDESASGVTVANNTVEGADNGIQVHVAANNVISGNRLYGNRTSQVWLQETRNTDNPAGDVFGNTVSANQMVALQEQARGLSLETRYGETEHFGAIDGNRYFDRIFANVVSERTAAARVDHTLAQWKATSRANGAPRLPDLTGSGASETPFAAVLVSGTNVVPNGDMATTSAGWAQWVPPASSAPANRQACEAGWCAQYQAAVAGGVLSSPNFTVMDGSWYRLSMDIATSANDQAIDLVLRRGGGGTNGYEALSDRALRTTAGTTWRRYTVAFKAVKTVVAGNPATGDLGARVDIQGIPSGLVVRVANLEVVPITPAQALARVDLLVNLERTARPMACPVAPDLAGQCATYVRLADDQPLAWPHTLAPFGAEIVYTRDPRLVDTDRDGIADTQDACPATAAGLGTNSRGCPMR